MSDREKRSDQVENAGQNEVELMAQSSAGENRLVDDRYQLQAELGRGAMGVVYQAWDRLLARPVAIKMLHPYLARDERYLKRFKSEARIIADLVHPNIVVVHSFGVAEDGAPYVVMEFIDGRPLSQVLSGAASPMPVGTAIELIIQVARGLAYAHAHEILHRDLKSSNVMLVETADRLVGKIVDFGIARREDEQSSTQTRFIGTPAYMSPEQCRGAAATESTELYALGCLIHETICGALPFQGETAFEIMQLHMNESPPALTSLRADAPKSLERLVFKLLAKDPAERYVDAEHLLMDLTKLASFLSGKESAPKIHLDETKLVRRGKKGSKIWLVGGLCGALLAIVGGALLFPQDPLADEPVPKYVTAEALSPHYRIRQLNDDFLKGRLTAEEAFPLIEKELLRERSLNNPDWEQIAASHTLVHMIYSKIDNLDKAAYHACEAARCLARAGFKPPHFKMASALADIGQVFHRVGEQEVARKYYNHAVAWLRPDTAMPTERGHDVYLRLLHYRALSWRASGQFAEAVRFARELGDAIGSKVDQVDWQTLAAVLNDAGHPDEVIALAPDAFARAADRNSTSYREVILTDLGQSYLLQGDPVNAQKCWEEVTRAPLIVGSTDHDLRSIVGSAAALGNLYLDQKRYQDAFDVLKKGYDAETIIGLDNVDMRLLLLRQMKTASAGLNRPELFQSYANELEGMRPAARKLIKLGIPYEPEY